MAHTIPTLRYSLLTASLLIATGALADADVPPAAQPGRLSIPLLQGGLPPAGEGECFAKVEVPASYGYESVEVPVRAATARFEIQPARLEPATRTVTLAPAHTVLAPRAAQLDTQVHRVEPEGRTARWVRGGLAGEQPPSSQELAALVADGIDPTSVVVGQCAIEHYKPGETVVEQRRVLVHEAHETLVATEAQFVNETHEIELAPEYGRLVEIPAVWRENQIEVITESARIAWEEVQAQLSESADESVLRRVTVPADTQNVTVHRVETPAMITRIEQPASVETVEIRRLVRDAQIERESVAARFENVDLPPRIEDGDYRWTLEGAPDEAGFEPTGRRVCLREPEPSGVDYERVTVLEPASLATTNVPAVTEQRDGQRLVADATYERIEVPGSSRRLTRRTLQAPAHQAWQPIVCDSALSADFVMDVQQALLDAGHSPNGVDGLIGPGTRRALQSLQEASGLAVGGLTLQSLDQLGVDVPSARPIETVELSEEP